MKVVCGSCGAKYSVADDKVAGKTVKIRCKKCSEVIVVRGDQTGFEEDEATRVFDYGGDAAWHVVVNGEQQGPFGPLQIGSMLMENKIDQEAYVWKEGFDGWKALRDVPELAQLAASKSEPQHVEAEMESDGADLFGTAPKAAPAGSDLFAGAAAKTGSAFAAGDDDEGVVSSKPATASPRVSAESASMTGQRNENSVLFSLSNLQALATGPATGPSASSSTAAAAASPLAGGPRPAAAASKPAGHAMGEASGLIDIRALAGATSSVAANKPAGGGSANVDDLLAIGSGPSPLAGGLGAPLLAAPVAAPKKEEEKASSSKAPMVLMGVVVVALIGAVGFLGYKIMNQQPQQVVVQQVVQGGGEGTGSTDTAPSNDTASGTETTAAANTTGTTTGRTTGRTTGTTGRTTGTTGTASTSTSNTTGRTTGTAATTTTTSSSSTTDAMRNLLMAPTTGSTTTTTEMAAAPSNLPAAPSRAEVGSALGGVAGQVRACGDGTTHGVANVAVTFRSSGSVSSASVSGAPFGGTPTAGCISRAVRSARVSPFSNPSFSVTYPYRL